MFTTLVIDSHVRTRQLIALMVSCLFAAFGAHAQMLQQPPQMGEPVPPNMVFTLDDSGSMWWECPVDNDCSDLEITPSRQSVSEDNFSGILVYDDADITKNADGSGEKYWTAVDRIWTRKLRSSEFNAIYYDPSVTYIPWLKADGTRYENADPTAAQVNGPYAPYTQNLENNQSFKGPEDWRTSRSGKLEDTEDGIKQPTLHGII